jgi:hypothetical protein
MDRLALEEQGGPAPAVQRELEEPPGPHALAETALDARGRAQEAVGACPRGRLVPGARGGAGLLYT